MMMVVVSVVCDKLEDSQSHLVQSSVHWHLAAAAAADINGSHQNLMLFQMQIKFFFSSHTKTDIEQQ